MIRHHLPLLDSLLIIRRRRSSPPQDILRKESFMSLRHICLLLISISLLLQGCSSPAAREPVLAEPAPVCEPEIRVVEREVVVGRMPDKAVLSLDDGARLAFLGDYPAARSVYESVLAQQYGLQVDALALWGLVNLAIDRNNPDYSREDAATIQSALSGRLSIAADDPLQQEARLVLASIKTLLIADRGKDTVVEENVLLKKELENREEAIDRLRELTVGQ